MNNKAEYELVQSFWVDDGELDGISKPECFVLGFEFCLVLADLDTGREFYRPIHEANAERIERACNERGRTSDIAPTIEGWCDLRVEAM